ncbi:hypothetical protein HPB48_020151 [Haemaphysalis longicornis]|uniref:Uncharacterized protein n=1 Tax=Haemaphysalis longicornis TaxID=44386 RepID=A0A9J6FHZ6_HAELO|nr:hypothetical protein HPB48_020151 [Haemaphysalis longicornis]
MDKAQEAAAAAAGMDYPASELSSLGRDLLPPPQVLDRISEIQLEAAELLDRELLPLSERELEIRKETVSLLKEKLEEAKLGQEKFQKELQELLNAKPA